MRKVYSYRSGTKPVSSRAEPEALLQKFLESVQWLALAPKVVDGQAVESPSHMLKHRVSQRIVCIWVKRNDSGGVDHYIFSDELSAKKLSEVLTAQDVQGHSPGGNEAFCF